MPLSEPSGGGVTSFNTRDGDVVSIEGDYGLELLGDVDLTAPALDQFGFRFDGSNWVNVPEIEWNTVRFEVDGNIQTLQVGARLVNTTPTSTRATILIDRLDTDTGWGNGASVQSTNAQNVIVGGVAGTTWGRNSSNDVGIIDSFRTGLTASTTQTQGQGLLSSGAIHVITTVANDFDVNTLPAVGPGTRCLVMNAGANILQLFPTSGDDLGNGVNIPAFIPAGKAIEFFSTVSVSLWQAIASTIAVANDAVQARRPAAFTLTTAFVDITLTATDVETNAAIIEHDNTNTDDIDIKVTGTYEIAYELDVDAVAAAGSSAITADGRVRLNDGGTGLAGSDASSGAEGATVGSNTVSAHLSNKFIANLTAGDFITLQLKKTEVSGSTTYTAEKISFQATRLL